MVKPSRKCQICDKWSSYGIKKEGKIKLSRCYIHRTNEMINRKGFVTIYKTTNKTKKICLECDRQATYSFKGWPIYCKIHKKPGMGYFKYNVCMECDTIGKFGIIGDNKRYCSKHKKPDMINLGSKKCLECNKSASFGYINGEQKYCSLHKKPNMVDLKHKKCLECNKSPSFGFSGEQPKYCLTHKLLDMIDVKHKTCKTDFCGANAEIQKYQGYCAYCYKNLFPDNSLSINHKTKERAVTDFIKVEFPNINMIFDKILGGCSNRRPDIFMELNTHVIIIEIDENSHTLDYYTSCENKRLCELYQDVAYRNMYIFRFNPDGYTNSNGKYITSPWRKSKTGVLSINNKTEWNTRLEELKIGIQNAIKNIPEKAIDIKYFFFESTYNENKI